MKGAPNNSSFLNQRRHEEAPEDSICKRDAFQRDRDLIMHSRAFRRTGIPANGSDNSRFYAKHSAQRAEKI